MEALCEHFARDALSMDEFERRLDRAHRVDSAEELRSLLSDLPRGGAELSPPPDSAGVPASRPPAEVRPDEVQKRRAVVALFGGNSRRGRWVPARKTLSLALMGGVVLDFREARLPPGVTEVRVLAVMGGVEIVVAPGTWVESDGLAIMGGFENLDEHPVRPDPGDPVIRVRGLAIMGSVEVTVRHPGEDRHEARRRRKAERSRRITDG